MSPREDGRRFSCTHCGGTNYASDVLSRWLRNHPQLATAPITLNDLDMQVRRFGTRRDREGLPRDVVWSQIVEFKTHGKALEAWQRDACVELDTGLRTKSFNDGRGPDGRLVPGHPPNQRQLKSTYDGTLRRVLHYGVHICTLSGDTPGTSDVITWETANGHWRVQITYEQLVDLLLFEIHPDSLKPISDYQHKPRRDDVPLFDVTNYLSADDQRVDLDNETC